MWFVYVLICEDKSLYTGISNDPSRRFVAHQNGKGSRYTRIHKPIKIVYLEKMSSRSDALKREYEIKSWSREKKMRELGIEL